MQRNKIAYRINLYTIIAVYFLILVGGIVRSTGSGMGCPDWPKCFGSYVPPTDDSSLPENYQQAYVDARVRKNARLSSTLSFLGFSSLAQKVREDVEIEKETYFDARKAWIEYVNRLCGVVIGILIVLNMAFSIRYWKTKRSVAVLSIVSFVLVLFQAWIGSLVVSTNLLPGFISFHMLLALLEIGLLLVQRFRMEDNHLLKVVGRNWLVLLLLLFTVQVLLGIQVREQIDVFKEQIDLPRNSWISSLGMWFFIHRSYSLLLIGLVGFLYYINFKKGKVSFQLKLLMGVVVTEILLGVIMAYFGVPAFAQPVHLLLGAVAIGLIFYLFLYASLKVNRS